MKLEINLNETVEVVLTAHGAEIYNSRWDEFAQFSNFPKKKYREGEVVRIQIWAMMQDFGPYTRLGMASPFEGNVLKIDKGVS